MTPTIGAMLQLKFVLIAVLLVGVGIGTSRAARMHTPEGLRTTGGLDSTFLIRQPPARPPVVDIMYHGGPVMSKPIKVYPIWYGTWPESVKEVVRTAIRSLTPKDPIEEYPNLANWWKIVTEYQSNPPTGPHVSNSVSIGGEVDDLYSQGKNFSGPPINDPTFRTVTDGAFAAIFQRALSMLPQARAQWDPLGTMILLFTAGDVTVTNLTGVCGHHSTWDKDRVYAHMFLSSTQNGLKDGCNAFGGGRFLGIPPNAKVSADGALDSMISVLMHEIGEAASDPFSLAPGWFTDKDGEENGDLCNFVYGGGDFEYCGMPHLYGDLSKGLCRSWPYSQVLVDEKSGVGFNQFGVGGSRFLVQQIWSRKTQSCQLQAQDPCTGQVNLTSPEGKIQVGVFVDDNGMQRYAAGEFCKWRISVPKAKNLTLTFASIATGFDSLDHIDVFELQTYVLSKIFFPNGTVSGYNTVSEWVQKLSISEHELDQNLKLHIEGADSLITFTSFSKLAPYPEATGFQLQYKAEF